MYIFPNVFNNSNIHFIENSLLVSVIGKRGISELFPMPVNHLGVIYAFEISKTS